MNVRQGVKPRRPLRAQRSLLNFASLALLAVRFISDLDERLELEKAMEKCQHVLTKLSSHSNIFAAMPR
jgi:hypothetical protein